MDLTVRGVGWLSRGCPDGMSAQIHQDLCERAARNNVDPDLILDLDHDALQAVVDSYWSAFDRIGAFLYVGQK